MLRAQRERDSRGRKAPMVRPTCRFCGRRVTLFGDVCSGCGGEAAREAAANDGLVELTNADLRALETKGDET